ncbi:MAG: hypothetical protein MUE70_12790 [Desulfobacterales bacterium]|jgi:hypothetical protein|uniref:PepSY domain-containing protein n=1 Tax=Desulfoprunum benzoelyticum TaxID=1506996 RepID=A0A840US08_9BACT|nr:hypothetical protein [Desulfoprunum benzoelyticum]MBB5348572.1 hypothetical protein [Desulfoprunum benzoelyticum]MBM9529832.1 hypothetical protein [Desulfoprunum benzoelyticum]MCU0600117.1 hypothetical protein [Desulfobacterales bacterium]
MQSKNVNQKSKTEKSTDEETIEDGQDPLARYFDGMGTATARIIINRHLDDDQWEKYGLKDLKNTGRYYIARLVEKDGIVIDEVLIDKQSGTIQSLRGRIGAGGLKR